MLSESKEKGAIYCYLHTYITSITESVHLGNKIKFTINSQMIPYDIGTKCMCQKSTLQQIIYLC